MERRNLNYFTKLLILEIQSSAKICGKIERIYLNRLQNILPKQFKDLRESAGKIKGFNRFKF